jgi:hypothetical protein
MSHRPEYRAQNLRRWAKHSRNYPLGFDNAQMTRCTFGFSDQEFLRPPEDRNAAQDLTQT